MPQENWKLPPLRDVQPPAVPVELLVTVGRVTLTAGDAPRGVLKEFYARVLGLTLVEASDDRLRFRHLQREILLERGRPEVGRLALLVRQFGDALLRLRGRNVPYELLHTDGGLTRTAIARDPAGNWIHLLETRAF